MAERYRCGKDSSTSVEGYVENLRLRFYLNQWQSQHKSSQRVPSTDEVYQIMVAADQKEKRDSARPFHIERMADSIIRNNVREPIIDLGDGKTELWDGNRRFFGTKHDRRRQGLCRSAADGSMATRLCLPAFGQHTRR